MTGMRGGPQTGDRERDVPGGMRRVGVELREIPPDHEADHAVVGDFAAGKLARVLSVAQDHDPVGQFDYLAETVGNVEDAHPVGAEILDHFKEPLRLALGETGGRFVHDEKPGLDREGLRDFDELLTADRQVADEGRRIEVESDPVEKRPGTRRDLALVDETPFHRLPSEEEIGSDAEIRRQVQFLVDQGDAPGEPLLDGTDLHRLPVEPDFPGVRSLHPREDLHERAFPGAVLTEHGHHLARSDGETHVVEGAHSGKGLPDSRDLQQIRHGRETSKSPALGENFVQTEIRRRSRIKLGGGASL